MAIGDLYRCNVCLSTPSGAFTFSQLYKMLSGTIDSDSADQAVSRWHIQFHLLLRAMLSDECALEEITWQPESGVDEVPGLTSYASQDGDIASPALPLNVAAIISQLTDAPSAGANGRVFIAGVPESAMETSIQTVVYNALVQAFADELAEAVVVVIGAAATYAPVILSRFLNGVPRTPAVAHFVSSNLAKRQLRQQRRRTTNKRGLTS